MTTAMRRGERTEPTASANEVWVQEKGLPHASRGRDVSVLKDRILVATDLGPISRDVEERAMDAAADDGASLVVAAIVPPGADTGRLDDIARRARERGIETETQVMSGDPVEALLEIATSVGATGIVVGDDQWRGEMPHPCVCAPLIRLAACPVLVVHPCADHAHELTA